MYSILGVLVSTEIDQDCGRSVLEPLSTYLCFLKSTGIALGRNHQRHEETQK